MEPFDSKIASLTYLTNPLYQQVLKQQTQNTVHNNKSDIKFYRKRITALTKDMLKGDIPENSYIKTIYETYVNGLIKYFKMVDTSDIIQQQYVEDAAPASASEAASPLAIPQTNKEITIDNNTMMRKHTGISTLDNFVIKQPNESKETRIIPLIIDVDLKEPSLKKKGVKEKIKKGEVKEKV
jgi:hypothetical protein